MTAKQPRLRMTVRYSLKDMPPDYRGLVGENWTYGDKPGSFSMMVRSVMTQMGEFYTFFTDPDTMNAELDKLREWLATVEVRGKLDLGSGP